MAKLFFNTLKCICEVVPGFAMSNLGIPKQKAVLACAAIETGGEGISEWTQPGPARVFKLYSSAGGLLPDRLLHEVEAITIVITTSKAFGKDNCVWKNPREQAL